MSATGKFETLEERDLEAPKMDAKTVRRAVALYAAAALVALIGLADAIYLTVEHLKGESVRCTVTTGCSEVLTSPYATFYGGIPLAALGALAYFTVFSLATLAAFGYPFVRPLLGVVVALMFAATLWLLYIQAFVLHQFCEYCLLSAAVTITLTGLVAAAAWQMIKTRNK